MVSIRKLKKIAPRIKKADERLKTGGSWRDGKNASSTQRGYTYEWQQYRLEYLRLHPLCAIAGEGCTLAATVVDHIIPHQGDKVLFWDPMNHQPACKHCHDAHKQRIERGMS